LSADREVGATERPEYADLPSTPENRESLRPGKVRATGVASYRASDTTGDTLAALRAGK
jgi:hypothetical protein